MNTLDRRHFLGSTLLLTGLASTRAQAQATLPPLDEASPQAMAMGYRRDTAQADAKKYPKHAADQHCGNCQLYQGKAGDASGPCPIFAGKSVQSAGWCNAWVKKAA